MAYKKYTQPIFDSILSLENAKSPFWRNVHGDFGRTYKLFAEITLIRKQKSMTQKQLAKMAGITQPALARIEAGRANPTLIQVVKIIRALDCELTINML